MCTENNFIKIGMTHWHIKCLVVKYISALLISIHEENKNWDTTRVLKVSMEDFLQRSLLKLNLFCVLSVCMPGK